MKIAVFSDDFPPDVAGGAGIMAFRIAKEFIKNGHEVLVISTTTDKGKIGKANFDGIDIFYIHSNYHERWRSYVSLWNPLVLRQIRKILEDFRPTVVHAHNVHKNLSFASLLLAKKYAQKVFMTAHDIMTFYPGTFTEFIVPSDLSCPNHFNFKVTPRMVFSKFGLRFNPFRNLVIKKILNKIDGVITVSQALKDALVQNGIPVYAVIYNGINPDEWHRDAKEVQDFKRKLNVEDKKLVFFGGRLSGAKGGDVILRAMSLIVRKEPNTVLLVAGRTGPYSEGMFNRSTVLGLAHNVVFTGWLDEESSKLAYNSADVVVVPSVCFDSFPNNNLEAFAARKPVVATCFGGSREIVRNEENGAIVNPLDVSTMATAILAFLADNEKSRIFGENGWRLINSRFLISQTAAAYLSSFNQSS